MYAEVAGSPVQTIPLSMEFCATFLVAPRNAQVMAVVHGVQEEGH